MKKLLLLLLPFAVSCTVEDAEICRFRNDRQAAVSLTFDDGIVDHYTLVAPQLDRLGLKATFWIGGSNIGHDDVYAPRLTWDMCREMTAAGHEISNHGWAHRNLTQLSDEEIREEVVRNDDVIEQETGVRPTTFCYPFNAINARAAAIAGQGRVGLRTFQEAQGQANSHSTAESLDRWLRGVIRDGSWGVTMTHGIHHGWDQWDDEQVLWSFFDRLAAKQDSVWVDTFAKVSAYITERDSCTIRVTRTGGRITITPSCRLDPTLYKETLTARIRGRLTEFDPFGGPQTFKW